MRIELRDATGGRHALASLEELAQLRAGVPALQSVEGALVRGTRAVSHDAGETREVGVALVTDGYFEALGVSSRLGSLLGRGQAETPDVRLAIISEHLWRVLYRRDPAVVGTRLLVEGEPFTIIGVASRFRGHHILWHTDVWLPLTAGAIFGDPRMRPPNAIVGRLRPDYGPEAVAVQAEGVVSGFAHETRLRDTRRVLTRFTISPGLPPLEHLAPDWKVAGIAGLAAGGAVCMAGFVPALIASRVPAAAAMREDGAWGPVRTGVLRNALIAVQVAIALSLLATMSVLARTVVELRAGASANTAPPCGRSSALWGSCC